MRPPSPRLLSVPLRTTPTCVSGTGRRRAWAAGGAGADPAGGGLSDGEVRAPRRLDHQSVAVGVDSRHVDVAQVVVERGHCRCLATWAQAKEATLMGGHPLRRIPPGRCVVDVDQRQTRTGILLWIRTLWVSLPSTRPATPLRPCEAMRIRSPPSGVAVSMMPS